jgi:hypothetical protein
MRSASIRSINALAAAGIGLLGVMYASGGSVASASSPDHLWPIGNPSTVSNPWPIGNPIGNPWPGQKLNVQQILLGTSLHHSFTPAGSMTTASETLSNPDDITRLGNDLFVGFQNGVGPQGEQSADGNPDSTVVELTLSGQPVGQWDIAGKADGVTADPQLNGVIATVNEDANSALYTITPSASSSVTRYAYNEPLPHDGGTDAISLYNGQVLISASAPGTTGAPAPQATYPAVYSVALDPNTQVATVTPVFYDEDSATVANINSPQFEQSSKLGLTDPDSNEVVPSASLRFGGDFMLTSQGDQQQIYLNDAGGSHQSLSVLSLSQSVDDTAWPTVPRGGSLYSTDSTNDAVDLVTGPLGYLPLVVATPCGANSAPATCPAPPTYPANYLATLNPWTGQVSPLAVQGAAYVPQGGLVFVPGHFGFGGDQDGSSDQS